MRFWVRKDTDHLHQNSKSVYYFTIDFDGLLSAMKMLIFGSDYSPDQLCPILLSSTVENK